MSEIDLTPSWANNPENEEFEEFVFLIVDVNDSSRLFTEDMQEDELQENAAALNAVYAHILKCLGDLAPGSQWEWNWAGDGGVFAFPTKKLHTTVRVFECAKRIAELAPFKKGNDEWLQLSLRIVIHRGKALFHTNKGLRRSAALNSAAKLRVTGGRTSLTITDQVRQKLKEKDRLDVLRAVFVGPHPRQKVYGYVPLMQQALKVEIAAAKANDELAQAAHLSYRLGQLNLGVGKSEDAGTAFQEAMDFINAIGFPKHRYYYRTLREFYRLWRIVALDARELLHHAEGHDWQKMMRPGDLSWDTFVDKHRPAGAWQLLMQVEVIMEQLEILAGQPVNDPVGLTSLEVCLLLERFGYPRTWYGTAIQERLDRIQREMKENYGRSVDDDCSICTGVAASCLILDRRDKDAEALVQWLHERDNDGFCYRGQDSFGDAAPGEHAVHYAGTVLQAFVDNGATRNGIYIEKALEVFFGDSTFAANGFPVSWTRYRNNTLYDFATYIFPTFARYVLAGQTLDDSQAEILRRTLQSLAIKIDRDGFDALLKTKSRGRVYGARENVGSFALGVLLGLPTEAIGILDYNLKQFSAYAARQRTDAQRQRTIDSSIDRARKMIEGWLLQFECALHLRENNLPIPEQVTRWLGVGAESPLEESRQ